MILRNLIPLVFVGPSYFSRTSHFQTNFNTITSIILRYCYLFNAHVSEECSPDVTLMISPIICCWTRCRVQQGYNCRSRSQNSHWVKPITHPFFYRSFVIVLLGLCLILCSFPFYFFMNKYYFFYFIIDLLS